MLYLTSTLLTMIFFWLLFMGLAIGQRFRQTRLEQQEAMIRHAVGDNRASKHILAYVHSPLDELQIWHKPQVSVQANAATPGPLVLPLRYQHTLLFADDLGETRPNPHLSKVS